MIGIADELAIRELNAPYIDAVNRGDGASWQATWAQDDFVVMSLDSGTLAEQGCVVSGRWYVTEHLPSRDGAGQWQFKQRSYHVIHQGACDLSGGYQPIPE